MNVNVSKPSGLTPEYAAQFGDAAIVQAYAHREPYSERVFEILSRLMSSSHDRILDLGCGTGDLTLGLSRIANEVDAVDISREMLGEARKRSSKIKNINWIESSVETAELTGFYDLVTSAQSFHWMDWAQVAAKLKMVLKPGAFLAIVARQYSEKVWWDQKLQSIIDQYSTNREFQAYELITELKKSGLFTVVGDEWTEPVSFTQSVEDLVESFHSRNGFSRDRMTAEAAQGFDREAAEHLRSFAHADGLMNLKAVSRVTWLSIN